MIDTRQACLRHGECRQPRVRGMFRILPPSSKLGYLLYPAIFSQRPLSPRLGPHHDDAGTRAHQEGPHPRIRVERGGLRRGPRETTPPFPLGGDYICASFGGLRPRTDVVENGQASLRRDPSEGEIKRLSKRSRLISGRNGERMLNEALLGKYMLSVKQGCIRNENVTVFISNAVSEAF